MLDFIKKIVGTKNERAIKRLSPYVEEINDLEGDFQKLSDAELRGKTDQFKARLLEATAPLRKSLEEASAELAAASGDQREELKSGMEELDKEIRKTEA